MAVDTIGMWAKYVVIFLGLCSLVPLDAEFLGEQFDGKFFRKDYIYIDEFSSFYKINTLLNTWADAKFKCQLEGAALFYPEDEDEADAVISLWNVTEPNIEQMYIGVADWNVKEIYETVDGRSVSDVYNNWAFNEPDNAGGVEGCVVMQRDRLLKDVNCNSKNTFICKKTLGTFQWNKDCNMPDPGYKYNKILDKCYKFHLTPRNWTDAYKICAGEQSYLAIINSREEDNHLITLTAEAPKDNIRGDYLRGAVHLGFHNKNGHWETIKGEPLHLSGFGDGWGYAQPDGRGSELCGSMFYTGQLNDIGCWQRMFFICEHDAVSSHEYAANVIDIDN